MDAGSVGTVAMWGAVAAAGGAVAIGVTRGRTMAQPLSVAALGFASLATAALGWALLTGDFDLAYVAETTTRQGGWPYRLAGLWGGDAGSLLLWATVILVVGAMATRRDAVARSVATATGGAVVLIVALADNPFRRLAIPAIDGGGLNPILRYQAMLYHPLLLYAGHAGMVAPFALSVAALIRGRVDPGWLRVTRRWMTAAWLVLGVGLLAGAHWAYVELGWGGFWGWDPVENSGLLPWLAATAFLHAARRRDDTPTAGIAALACVPFCLSVLGTAISRSGAAQSVHTFAEGRSVARAATVLLIALVATVVTAAVRARRPRPRPSGSRGPRSSQSGCWPRFWVYVRAPDDTDPHPEAQPTPRTGRSMTDQAVLTAAFVLLAIAAVVAVGTMFPVAVHAATGDTIAVTTRYYAATVTPLAVVGVLLMGFGPGRWRRWWLPAAAGATTGATAVVLAGPAAVAPYALAAEAGVALLSCGVQLRRPGGARRIGLLLAHAGMAVLLVGVGGSLLGRQSTQVVGVGASMHVDGYTLRYRRVLVDQGNGWQRARTVLAVLRGGRQVGVLTPGLRNFDGQPSALADVALHSTPAGDLEVAVRAIDPGTDAAQLQVTVLPLVDLVWCGGLLAAAGGVLVLLAGRRARLPAPVRVAVPEPRAFAAVGD